MSYLSYAWVSNLTLIEGLFLRMPAFMPCKLAYCSSMCLWILWCICKLFLAFVTLFYYELFNHRIICKCHFMLYCIERGTRFVKETEHGIQLKWCKYTLTLLKLDIDLSVCSIHIPHQIALTSLLNHLMLSPNE